MGVGAELEVEELDEVEELEVEELEVEVEVVEATVPVPVGRLLVVLLPAGYGTDVVVEPVPEGETLDWVEFEKGGTEVVFW